MVTLLVLLLVAFAGAAIVALADGGLRLMSAAAALKAQRAALLQSVQMPSRPGATHRPGVITTRVSYARAQRPALRAAA